MPIETDRGCRAALGVALGTFAACRPTGDGACARFRAADDPDGLVPDDDVVDHSAQIIA